MGGSLYLTERTVRLLDTEPSTLALLQRTLWPGGSGPLVRDDGYQTAFPQNGCFFYSHRRWDDLLVAARALEESSDSQPASSIMHTRSMHSTGRQRARIHQIADLAFDFLIGSVQRGARQSHQARPRRFQDPERHDQLHEGVDATGFGGAVGK